MMLRWLLLLLASTATAGSGVSSTYLLLVDEGCPGCRGEAFVDGELAAITWGGQPAALVRVDDIRRPDASGQSELLFYVRGAEGGGKMSVRIGRGTQEHGVVVFEDGVRRYALLSTPHPEPFRLRFPMR